MKNRSGTTLVPAESTESSTPAAPTGIRERIRAALPSFSPAERRVADAVLRDAMAVIHLSVSELAALAETSPATVVRLCASVGLRGYQDLKIRLASESIPNDQRLLGDITADDTVSDVAHKVMDATARAVSQASRTLDAAALDRIVDALIGARRVVFGAVGTSAPLALDTAYRLVTLGIDASFAPDVHTQHVTARMMGAGDVFFAISHTGSTFETLATARAAQSAGATTVALTSFSRSPLTELSDLSVVAGSAETAYRVEAMASRIVHLSVLDALFVSVSRRSATSTAHLALTEDVLIEHRI
ncbi:RpiR family transcriptional regulator [Frondihabitans sucicola]|uniref:RpiR family transcriptional regulator n=1 Tax=Frondihabitans sucicola TaxID=1268041 RepID=A0ABM8GU46_9MICO|nr:MurR/RpiR family transcriptional regulator [Frondihabitans sucicola]BDZ51889.1 RpiR family transcriptional regulator [Frondihabitans sucicola]